MKSIQSLKTWKMSKAQLAAYEAQQLASVTAGAAKFPAKTVAMTKQQARAFCDRCPDFARGCALTCKHFPNA